MSVPCGTEKVKGDYRKVVLRASGKAFITYCTHPEAKKYTCTHMCSHGFCPLMREDRDDEPEREMGVVN